MFENLIRKQYGGGTIEGGHINNIKEREKEVSLPDKIQKILEKNPTIQGTYRFIDKTGNTLKVRLATTEGILGEIHLENFNYKENIIKRRKPFPTKEIYFSNGHAVFAPQISFIPLEQEKSHWLFGISEKRMTETKWGVGIFILCLFP